MVYNLQPSPYNYQPPKPIRKRHLVQSIHMASIAPTLPGISPPPAAEPKNGETGGFSDQLHQAVKANPDRPDPGGAPPGKTSTVGRASEPGPNAQSKQPDSPTSDQLQAAYDGDVSGLGPHVCRHCRPRGGSHRLRPGHSHRRANRGFLHAAPTITAAPQAVAAAIPVTIRSRPDHGRARITNGRPGGRGNNFVGRNTDGPEPDRLSHGSVGRANRATHDAEPDHDPAATPTPDDGHRPSARAVAPVVQANSQTPAPKEAPKATAGQPAVNSSSNDSGGGSGHTNAGSGSNAGSQKDQTPGQTGQNQPDPNAAAPTIATSPMVQGPSAPTPITAPLDSAQRIDVVKQVANHIETMAVNKSNQEVTIQLRPEGLGDVTVVVKSLGTGIEATLTASNDNVRAALSDNRDALTQAATAKGFNLSLSPRRRPGGVESEHRQPSRPKAARPAVVIQPDQHGNEHKRRLPQESRRSTGHSGAALSSKDSPSPASPSTFSAVSVDGLDYRT